MIVSELSEVDQKKSFRGSYTPGGDYFGFGPKSRSDVAPSRLVVMVAEWKRRKQFCEST